MENPYYSDKNTDIELMKCMWDYKNTELNYFATSDLTEMDSYPSMKVYDEHEVDVNFIDILFLT